MPRRPRQSSDVLLYGHLSIVDGVTTPTSAEPIKPTVVSPHEHGTLKGLHLKLVDAYAACSDACGTAVWSGKDGRFGVRIPAARMARRQRLELILEDGEGNRLDLQGDTVLHAGALRGDSISVWHETVPVGPTDARQLSGVVLLPNDIPAYAPASSSNYTVQARRTVVGGDDIALGEDYTTAVSPDGGFTLPVPTKNPTNAEEDWSHITLYLQQGGRSHRLGEMCKDRLVFDRVFRVRKPVWDSHPDERFEMRDEFSYVDAQVKPHWVNADFQETKPQFGTEELYIQQLACVAELPRWLTRTWVQARVAAARMYERIDDVLSNQTAPKLPNGEAPPSIEDLTEPLFGLARLGHTEGPKGLARLGNQAISRALRRATRRGFIRGYESGNVVDTFKSALQVLGDSHGQRTTRRAMNTFFGANSDNVQEPQDVLQAVYNAMGAGMPRSSQFLDDLPQGTISAAARAKVRGALTTRALFGPDDETLQNIQQLTDGAAYGAAVGAATVQTLRDSMTAAPSWSPASSRRAHARWMQRRIDRAFPLEALAGGFESDSADLALHLRALGASGKTLKNIAETDIDDSMPTNLPSIIRLAKLAPPGARHASVKAMMSVLQTAGQDLSAAGIETMGREAFITAMEPALDAAWMNEGVWRETGGNRSQEQIDEDQSRAKAVATVIAKRARSTTGVSTIRAVSDALDDWPTVAGFDHNTPVDARDAVGWHQDAFEISDPCDSNLGPSAYFLDLLDMLNRDGTLLAELRAKRPELTELDLGCDNAEIVLPTIDLVIELLEQRVVGEAPGSSLPTTTTGTPESLRVEPVPSEFREAANLHLSTLDSPRAARIDLVGTELDLLLARENQQRGDLMPLLQTMTDAASATHPTPDAREIAAAALGLSPSDLRLLEPVGDTDSENVDPVIARLGNVAAWPADALEVPHLLVSLDIDIDELERLLALPCVSPALTAGIFRGDTATDLLDVDSYRVDPHHWQSLRIEGNQLRIEVPTQRTARVLASNGILSREQSTEAALPTGPSNHPTGDYDVLDPGANASAPPSIQPRATLPDNDAAAWVGGLSVLEDGSFIINDASSVRLLRRLTKTLVVARAFHASFESISEMLIGVLTRDELITGDWGVDAVQRLHACRQLAMLAGLDIAEIGALIGGWTGVSAISSTGALLANAYARRFQDPTQFSFVSPVLALSPSLNSLVDSGPRTLQATAAPLQAALDISSRDWLTIVAAMESRSPDTHEWIPTSVLSLLNIDRLTRIRQCATAIGCDIPSMLAYLQLRPTDPFNGTRPDIPGQLLTMVEDLRRLQQTDVPASQWLAIVLNQGPDATVDADELLSTIQAYHALAVRNDQGLQQDLGAFDHAVLAPYARPHSAATEAEFSLVERYLTRVLQSPSNPSSLWERLHKNDGSAGPLFEQIVGEAIARFPWLRCPANYDVMDTTTFDAWIADLRANGSPQALATALSEIADQLYFDEMWSTVLPKPPGTIFNTMLNTGDSLTDIRDHIENTYAHQVVADPPESGDRSERRDYLLNLALQVRVVDLLKQEIAYADDNDEPEGTVGPLTAWFDTFLESLTDSTQGTPSPSAGRFLARCALRPTLIQRTADGLPAQLGSTDPLVLSDVHTALAEAARARRIAQRNTLTGFGAAMEGSATYPWLLTPATITTDVRVPQMENSWTSWATYMADDTHTRSERSGALHVALVPFSARQALATTLGTWLGAEPEWVSEVLQRALPRHPFLTTNSTVQPNHSALAELVHPASLPLFGSSSWLSLETDTVAWWRRQHLVRLARFHSVVHGLGLDLSATLTMLELDGTLHIDALPLSDGLVTTEHLEPAPATSDEAVLTALTARVFAQWPSSEASPVEELKSVFDGEVGLLGWTPRETLDLLGAEGLGITNAAAVDAVGPIRILDRLLSIQPLAATFGVSPPALLPLRTYPPTTQQVEAWKASLKVAHGPNWGQVYLPIADELRVARRDALVAAWLHARNASTPDVTFDTRDLAADLLADPLVTPALTTTRMLFATSSVQQFITRCTLGLEAQSLNASNTRDWAWKSRYRVWEANRKVLFYPENWVDPSLRLQASSLYRELEDGLAGSSLAEDELESLYGDYLRGLHEVGNLRILSHDRSQSPTSESETTYELHLLARARGDRGGFYYRNRSIHGAWAPWERVHLGIRSENVAVAHVGGKTVIAWLEVDTVSAATKLTSDTEPIPYASVTLAVAVRTADGWPRDALRTTVGTFGIEERPRHPAGVFHLAVSERNQDPHFSIYRRVTDTWDEENRARADAAANDPTTTDDDERFGPSSTKAALLAHLASLQLRASGLGAGRKRSHRAFSAVPHGTGVFGNMLVPADWTPTRMSQLHSSLTGLELPSDVQEWSELFRVTPTEFFLIPEHRTRAGFWGPTSVFVDRDRSFLIERVLDGYGLESDNEVGAIPVPPEETEPEAPVHGDIPPPEVIPGDFGPVEVEIPQVPSFIFEETIMFSPFDGGATLYETSTFTPPPKAIT